VAVVRRRRPERVALNWTGAGRSVEHAPVVLHQDPKPSRPLWRRMQWIILAVNVVFWGAILVWTMVGDHPDHLITYIEDRRFPEAAEPVCARAVDQMRALERDPVADSADERATTVDLSNDILRGMLAELRQLPRPEGVEGEWVAQWLDDWDTHVGDRQRWADGLRDGENEPFTETAREGEQISQYVDFFAEANEMESCETTHDV
jgi:hypothetical protein